jgi:hypothetical protein
MRRPVVRHRSMQHLDMRWQDEEEDCVNQSGGGKNDGPFLVLEAVVATDDDAVVILGGCIPPTKLDGNNDVVDVNHCLCRSVVQILMRMIRMEQEVVAEGSVSAT